MSEERAELSGTDLPGTGPGDARLPTTDLPTPELRDPEQSATEPPRTGLEPVDRVLAREVEIGELPVTQRAAAYAALHAELERILEARPGHVPSGLTSGAGGSVGPGQQRGPGKSGANERARSAR
ncbi:hypothetical protein [Kocuria salsicia]|uniref:hypothetical protein n=1 Tax=Kocuria salsicia TaxID=664639 RepID=UPI0033EE3B97